MSNSDSDDAARFARPVGFGKILDDELRSINRRRELNRRPHVRFAAERPDLIGLALSGGGIRSAAVCLGAIQSLRSNGRLHNFDYCSSVSGGGYTAACLNASMSAKGGGNFPFGDDVSDSPVVAHIRNFSNYLLPRSHSAIRNWLEAGAVLLRGLIANLVCTLAFSLPTVLLLVIGYPNTAMLSDPNLLARIIAGFAAIRHGEWYSQIPLEPPFAVPMILPATLCALLLVAMTAWALAKSVRSLDTDTNDTKSAALRIVDTILLSVLVAAVLDLQPLLMHALLELTAFINNREAVAKLLPVLAALSSFIGTFAGRLSRFIETSGRSQSRSVSAMRWLSQALLLVGALILPILIWLSSVTFYLWILAGQPFRIEFAGSWLPTTRFGALAWLWVATVAITSGLRANNYSLHWFYRDRLSTAFLVSPAPDGSPASADADPGVTALEGLKLTQLQDSKGPYPIINCALNIQGSLAANKRGRNADFFIFTPDHVGSALTGYVRTADVEKLDPRLGLGSAMAISGAAASANMGSSTVRILSPTLSLLNVRLGYYLRNPFYFGEEPTFRNRIREIDQRFRDQFFLLIEMVNGLNEFRRTIFLSDGGHIENLGTYELLKRRCRFILVIDSEADPELAFGSLLKLERYARIDLGVRIALPWEPIADQSRRSSAAIAAGGERACDKGPHCAIGKIVYPEGPPGILLYAKSSLTGDERDYILDYARRRQAFPHESTSDQFFSEEQFEMYRALGFHIVDGLFGRDEISFVKGKEGFSGMRAVRDAIDAALPKKQ